MKLVYKNLKQFYVPKNLKISEYLKKIDKFGAGFVLVIDDCQLLNIITDGDLRRALINGKSIDDIYSVKGKPCTFTSIDTEYSEVLSLIESEKLDVLPLTFSDNSVAAIFTNAKITEDYSGFIMAGGEGKRLRPLTLTTAKPLLKIAGKSLLDRAISSMNRAGVSQIEISVNYLANQFEQYIEEKDAVENLNLIHEHKKLGTAGSLALAAEAATDLVVCNADLVTDFDYVKLVINCVANNNDLVVGVRRHKTTIPFGVLRSENNKVLEIQEKPEIENDVAAGIYFLRREVLNLIPNDHFYDMPELINSCIENGLKVGIQHVDGAWIDVGRKEQYDQAVTEHA